MSNVTLTIGGRTYAVACAQGEEEHIAGLGRMIDAKVSGITATGGTSEIRMLLFAALLLADDLHEATRATVGNPASSGNSAAKRLDQLAARLENLASHLEAGRPNA